MTAGRATPAQRSTSPAEVRTVGIVGGGAWGRALAASAARAGARVLLRSRREVPDIAGVERVERVDDEGELAERARLILLAVPSVVVRDVARSLGAHLDGRHFVVHGVRGLVPGGRRAGDEERARTELETIADVVRHETPVRRLGALGGPALAAELAAGRPSLMVAGSRYPEVLRELRATFGSPVLRLYTTEDLLGLEWASALVGCLAIGVGYARGVGLGPGLIAAVITRAIDEAARLAAAAGGDERTLLGLAGTGDLLACIAQPERPEVLVGEALARGQALEGAVAAAGQRVEAVDLIGRVADWADARGLRAPIFHALAHGVLRGQAPQDLVHQLMTGPAD
jgi:glycerol-3-phosphate dehydrogenase (NAD(P)+)